MSARGLTFYGRDVRMKVMDEKMINLIIQRCVRELEDEEPAEGMTDGARRAGRKEFAEELLEVVQGGARSSEKGEV
jgi:hypothetical protein